MIDQLLSAKFYIPPLRPGLVRRPRLLQKMDQGFQSGSRLTLITAPAGYGKSTLAAEWISDLRLRIADFQEGPGCYPIINQQSKIQIQKFAWLSLDRDDNHPAQFLGYFIAALEQVDEAIGRRVWSVLEALDPPENSAEQVQIQLTELLNAIAAVPQTFVLVLDDYHLITDLAVHQALGLIIERQPPQMHLVITTRQDPLLPLAKLRSRGQLTEIRLGELRFTREEAGTFLNETMGLDLIPEQVAALDARTEGWIAGLQLAALSLTELPAGAQPPVEAGQVSSHIQAFAGDDRHVMDFLMDEVLSRQPDEIQAFLLRTSVLKRLSGPLCDAVLDEGRKTEDEGQKRNDNSLSSFVHRPSSEILEQLERANLFIIPLDNRRQWYRYHHLFAELLRSRLQITDPELVSRLHGRASQWFEGAGMIPDAVDHALLAEDFERALHLIEQIARSSIWASGDLPVLLNWSRRLPEDVLLARPRLCLYSARALFFSGQVREAESYLRAAENALRARGGEGGSNAELWGVLFTNQATVRAMSGDSQAALELAAQAQVRVPAQDLSTQARIAHAVGTAQHLRGEVAEAGAAFAQAVQLARQESNRNLGLDSVSCLALAQILSGRLSQAVQTCQEALDDGANRLAPAACAVHLALAQVQYERNELRQAQESAGTTIELGRKAGWLHVLWQAYAFQALLSMALGDPAGAQEALDELEGVARRYPIPRVSRTASATRARLDLVEGRVEAAQRWVEAYRGMAPAGELRDFEELTLARLLISLGQPEQARPALDQLLQEASAAGRNATRIEALALRSCLLAALGEQDAAAEALVRALVLAEPEGFARPFLDQGREMERLLSRLRRSSAPEPAIRCAAGLLAAFQEQGSDQEGVPSPRLQPSSAQDAPEALLEPLSERELEVLGLIAEGLSNPQIAARLYLSVNTLRAHTTNIYQKLDVHSRTQAVARARELGLLP